MRGRGTHVSGMTVRSIQQSVTCMVPGESMTNEISQQLNGMALLDMTCSRVWAGLVSVRAPRLLFLH